MPRPPFPVDLLIWDLDGTLADTVSDIADSLNRTLAPLGIAPHSDETVKWFIGGGIRNLIARAVGCEPDENQVDALVKTFRADYQQNLTTKTRLFPGAEEVLDHFRDKRHVIISNKLQEMTRQVVEDLGVGDRFLDIIGQGGDYPIKPDPASTHAMMERHGAAPNRTVFIGDSRTDHDTARAAGCLSVLVTFGMRPRDEVIEYGGDAWVDELGELKTILA